MTSLSAGACAKKVPHKKKKNVQNTMAPAVIYHAYVTKNQKSIAKSKECGCIYCLKRFPVSEVEEYIFDGEEGNETALCPYCSCDAVVPDFLVALDESKLLQWHNEGFVAKCVV
jgi:hypothetical protein